MKYAFLDDDARLLEYAELPTAGGLAVAVRSTGYAHSGNEVLELSLVDMDGNTQFSERVHPQNVEDWNDMQASGGITPADVADAPELYQFEEAISVLVDEASVVVAAHLPYVEAMIEASWVTLPEFEGRDVVDMFCASHCSADYPDEPAAAASLAGIAEYYGVSFDDESTVGQARTAAACYRALIAEHARERDAKGQEYWDAYWQAQREANAADERASELARMREHRFNQMNGLLWIAGGIIFTSLVIQLAQRGGDVGFMVVAGAAAAFCFVRGIVNFRK